MTKTPFIVQICSNYELKDRSAKGLTFRPFRFKIVERWLERAMMRSADMVMTDSTFTSYDPTGGGWCGIWVRYTGGGTSFDASTIDDGGNGHMAYCSGWSDSANIVLDDDADVTNSTLSNSDGYGIVCNTSGSTISGNTYTGNTSGDEDGC